MKDKKIIEFIKKYKLSILFVIIVYLVAIFGIVLKVYEDLYKDLINTIQMIAEKNSFQIPLKFISFILIMVAFFIMFFIINNFNARKFYKQKNKKELLYSALIMKLAMIPIYVSFALIFGSLIGASLMPLLAGLIFFPYLILGMVSVAFITLPAIVFFIFLSIICWLILMNSTIYVFYYLVLISKETKQKKFLYFIQALLSMIFCLDVVWVLVLYKKLKRKA